MKTDTSMNQPQEEEVLDIPWETLILQGFREYKQKKSIDLKKKTEKLVLEYEQYMVQLPKGSKQPQDSQAILQKTQNCLLRLKNQLPFLLNEDHQQKNLMITTIQLLETVENYPYIFQQNTQLMFEIFACLTLKECSLQLLINSEKFRQEVIKWIQDNFLHPDQHYFEPTCQIIFNLLIMMMAHYNFLTQPDYELIQQVILCFKHSTQQALNTENERKKQHDAERLNTKNRRMMQQLKDEPSPEEQFIQVPKQSHDLLIIGLALIPSSICQMTTRQKFTIHSDLLKQPNVDIFRLTFAHKITQTLTNNFKKGELMNENDLIRKQLDMAKLHEYFTQPRECIKALNCLLKGYDNTIIWIKFDSDNFFDNSNQHELSIHGDPEKLQPEQGLFFDGCGASFDIGSCLELDKPLNIKSNSITISFWMVMFSPENSRNRSQKIEFRSRTLFCLKDGKTPLIFTDSYSQLFGITNTISDNLLSPIGMKFFAQKDTNKTYQGWNHVCIILDNDDAKAYLYLNGQLESSLSKVKTNFYDIKYIGNSANLQSPFGYICDLRIYSKVLTEEYLKQLGTYDKHQVKLFSNDIYSKFQEDFVLIDIKKLLIEYQNLSSETTLEILKIITKLCISGTIFRLQFVKYNLFEQIALLLYSPNEIIQIEAKKVLNAMR